MTRANLPCLPALLGLLVLGLCSTNVDADTLVTKSGNRFEGKVIEEGDRYILETPTGGRLPFSKDMVLEIIRSEEGSVTHKAEDSPRPEATARMEEASKVTLFMEIPLVGEIGTDILPEGVERCLQWCSQNPNIKHVVFRLHTPGGTVADAEAIREIMRRYDERFDYHALVEEAMSAGIWVVFACDTIHMVDGASLGAAVVFTPSPTGQVDVDAKFNSAVAAMMGSLAEAKGHSPILAKAMIVREAEAYAWQHGGKVEVASTVPKAIPPNTLVVKDTAQTVLSLTKDQAVAVGLAKPLRGGAEAIGASLGLSGWRKASNYTENVMLRVKQNREKEVAERDAAVRRNVERAKATILFISANAREAESNDPGNFVYYYDPATGLLTPESARLWQRQTDLATSAWGRVQSGIVELRNLEKEAEKLGLDRIAHDLNLADIYARAGREIARLLAERSRRTP